MKQILCQAEKDDGTRCDGLAEMTSARFIYKRKLIDGREEEVLSEIDYAIDCPKCGKRTIVDTADCDALMTAEIRAAREQFADQIPLDKSRLTRSSREGAFFVQMDSHRR